MRVRLQGGRGTMNRTGDGDSLRVGDKVHVQLEWDISPMVEVLMHRMAVQFHGPTATSPACGRVTDTKWELPRTTPGGVSAGWISLSVDLHAGPTHQDENVTMHGDCAVSVRIPMRLPVRPSEWLPADLHRGIDLPPLKLTWMGSGSSERGLAWLPPLQLEPPSPDTAMPYNIATVVSLLCAFSIAAMVTAGGRGPRPPPALP